MIVKPGCAQWGRRNVASNPTCVHAQCFLNAPLALRTSVAGTPDQAATSSSSSTMGISAVSSAASASGSATSGWSGAGSGGAGPAPSTAARAPAAPRPARAAAGAAGGTTFRSPSSCLLRRLLFCCPALPFRGRLRPPWPAGAAPPAAAAAASPRPAWRGCPPRASPLGTGAPAAGTARSAAGWKTPAARAATTTLFAATVACSVEASDHTKEPLPFGLRLSTRPSSRKSWRARLQQTGGIRDLHTSANGSAT